MFRTNIISAIFCLALTAPAFADSSYPQGPDPRVTPGSLCTTPDSYRYPEHIAYCDRNVSTGEKKKVIAIYNQQLGYNIAPGDRSQFKIDHFIPLCMGGSNNEDNLWPQHSSVYTITDPLEPLACQKMADGKLEQARAVELIKQAKLHLDQAAEVESILESL